VNGAQSDGAQRLEASVRGVVQGVGFRWFVTRTASRLGLVGWVANRGDGSVELVAEGLADRLDQLESALRSGPSGAIVEHLDARRLPAMGGFSRFEVRAGGHPGD
jgi:acylphosphatase